MSKGLGQKYQPESDLHNLNRLETEPTFLLCVHAWYTDLIYACMFINDVKMCSFKTFCAAEHDSITKDTWSRGGRTPVDDIKHSRTTEALIIHAQQHGNITRSCISKCKHLYIRGTLWIFFTPKKCHMITSLRFKICSKSISCIHRYCS